MWQLPKWVCHANLEKLLSDDILEKYTLFHDCGKPICKEVGEDGVTRFPNHATVSAKVWRDSGGCEQVARLIEMDMKIHTMKADEVSDFVKNPEAVSLLFAALAEIHANAELFGGLESTSFKIKYKQVDRRGAAIFRELV